MPLPIHHPNPLHNIYSSILSYYFPSSSVRKIVCAYIDCMLACVCAIADGVNEAVYHEPEPGAEYCELEPEISNPEPELPRGLRR
jgi:hypothetical protein